MNKELLKIARYYEKRAQEAGQMTMGGQSITGYQEIIAPLLGITLHGNSVNVDNPDIVVNPLFNEAAKLVQDTTSIDLVVTFGGPSVVDLSVLLGGAVNAKLTQMIKQRLLGRIKSTIASAIKAGSLTPLDTPYEWKAINFNIEF